MTDSELFDHYLVDFQPDLKKIIGKFKGLNHRFTDDEMLSEANLHLIKYKDKIINFTDEEEGVSEFCEIGFKKAAYSYTRNLVGWSQSRLLKNSYVRKRVDNTHYTENGELSTFELVCETLPIDEEYSEFDSNSKHKYILKLLTEYTQSLTPNELTIIEHLRQGKNQYTIASESGVTHQAVSIAVIKLVEKIKNYLKFDFDTDNSANKITKGNNAINSLFSNAREHFSPKDSKDLISFIKKNYKKYSLEELANLFKKGKFEKCQILGVLNFNSLGNHIRKKVPNHSSYTQEEVDLIIKMAKKGKYIEEIAEALNRKPRQISCKCANMIKNNLIKKCPLTKSNLPKFNKEESKKMLKMFKEGLSVEEVAKVFNEKLQSIGAKRGQFCRQGLIGLSAKSKKNQKCLLRKS
jgi:DNA-binding NarL/FixJ family response regulator